MNDNNDLLRSSPQTITTMFPGGGDDVTAFAESPKLQPLYNGMIVPPMEADYLQYRPNNKLLQFMNHALSEQDYNKRSFEKARERAMSLYTDDVTGSDNSLLTIKNMIKDYAGEVSQQEFELVNIGLKELTTEQLLRLIDEQSRLVKSSVNDRLQTYLMLCMVATTLITAYTVMQSFGTATPVSAAAQQAGKLQLRKFLASCTGKLALMYTSTVKRACLVAELIGDASVTFGEVANVWAEMVDPNVRADADTWAQISRYMIAVKKPEPYRRIYYMKPSEMIGLFAIWERGDRSVLDPRLRNLIYGKAAHFQTDLNNFSKIKFRIGKIGRYVEHLIGTPSLFPAMSLVLRLLSRMAAAKTVPVVGGLINAGLWFTRGAQFNAQSKE